MFKKIMLSLICATMLTSSFAMNTTSNETGKPEQIQNKQQNTATKPQEQTKSALWQWVNANPALSKFLVAYVSLIIIGNLAFFIDALAHGDAWDAHNDFWKNIRNKFFDSNADKWFNTDNDGSYQTMAYWAFCPGLPSIAMVKNNINPQDKIDLMLLLTPFVIALVISVVGTIFFSYIDRRARDRTPSQKKNDSIVPTAEQTTPDISNKINTTTI